jgi:hypothetical protein
VTDYFTQWDKGVPLTQVNEKVLLQFLEQHLITRFGVPSITVFDNVACFYLNVLFEFSLDKGIIMRY